MITSNTKTEVSGQKSEVRPTSDLRPPTSAPPGSLPLTPAQADEIALKLLAEMWSDLTTMAVKKVKHNLNSLARHQFKAAHLLNVLTQAPRNVRIKEARLGPPGGRAMGNQEARALAARLLAELWREFSPAATVLILQHFNATFDFELQAVRVRFQVRNAEFGTRNT